MPVSCPGDCNASTLFVLVCAEEINALIAAFDDAHTALKAEKLGLEADVKAGEMRLLVGFQELQLLREFDKRESVLLQKRQAKMDDKQVRGGGARGDGMGETVP